MNERYIKHAAIVILMVTTAGVVDAFSVTKDHSMTKSCSNKNKTSSTGVQSILSTLLLPALPFLFQPDAAFARDELFKPNPLTNPILEQIRILDQAEADNIRYGGELAPGSPRGRETYANLLVPILTIQSDLMRVEQLLIDSQGGGKVNNFAGKLDAMDKILSQPKFEKLQFKKTFNAFADNIYYSDPDRANAYLGGGAVPRNEQSIAYLLRNDILTNLEDLRAEVTYLIKEEKAGNVLETEDLFKYIRGCNDGMTKYLELVPPGEMNLARDILEKKGG